jgi:hypothetical protein
VNPAGHDFSDKLKAAENLLRQRRIPEAVDAYNTAEEQGYPRNQCAAGRWICWMLTGELDSAWRESDAIEARGAADPNRFWDGLPFDGRTVLLRALHGYGDAVQFIRYASLIRRSAERLIVQTHPEMMSILQRADGVDEVMTWPDPPVEQRRWDQQIEVMELPRAFRTTVESIPNRVPYISIDSALVQSSRERLGKNDKPKVGLLWASSGYDRSRSMDLELMRPLLRLSEIEFYSFQRGPERAQLAALGDAAHIHDTAWHSPEIIDTAVDLSNMDLLISVDTFAAHLAGALNRPVWLMLPFAADWRWMLDRDDSPWYPSMRLFRQTAAGNWKQVIGNVLDELKGVALRT